MILVRHAPPLVSGTCAGRSDIAVEPAGASAQIVLRALTAVPSAIVSSPSRRCHELAIELSRHLGLPLTLEPRAVELDFGEWEGLAWDEIRRADRSRFERWTANWRDEGPPGGESLLALQQRVADWLGESASSSPLAVTHAGVIRAARVLCGGQVWENALNEPVPYLVPVTFEAPSPLA